VLAGVGILSFYSVIAGWTVAYIFSRRVAPSPGSPEAIGTFFSLRRTWH
jgi:SNF family Na+-dependent transporter